MRETKLIVLRGPSGSGKSSTAKAIRLEQVAKNNKMAYVEQDYLRRIVLKEKDIVGGFNRELIKETVIFLLENQYDVILEGIFDKGRYEKMFQEITGVHPSGNFFFYFDISLEETLKRHNTKPNKDDFGEKEMRSWYKDKDLLEFVQENVITERSTQADIIQYIQVASQL